MISKILFTGLIDLIWLTHCPTHLVDFFEEEEDSVPVRAPPTEAPEVDPDEYSGHQTPTVSGGEMLIRGQDIQYIFIFFFFFF